MILTYLTTVVDIGRASGLSAVPRLLQAQETTAGGGQIIEHTVTWPVKATELSFTYATISAARLTLFINFWLNIAKHQQEQFSVFDDHGDTWSARFGKTQPAYAWVGIRIVAGTETEFYSLNFTLKKL